MRTILKDAVEKAGDNELSECENGYTPENQQATSWGFFYDDSDLYFSDDGIPKAADHNARCSAMEKPAESNI